MRILEVQVRVFAFVESLLKVDMGRLTMGIR